MNAERNDSHGHSGRPQPLPHPVPLPGNPLKNLNAYLIRGPRNLLVDTGFRQEACRQALAAGLAELEVSMADTDIFLTHLHSDHAGLAPEFLAPTSRIFVSATDGPDCPARLHGPVGGF